ncbi:response regulator transcription factor [Halarcobacter anaerophilus]|uniref:DNA-binding response regulator n=1 Tax=Halarcobacter anaerophilus TaxID=877500 RepID=A0A4V1LPJ8_9BACT|nr:response regulator [Halarcobacter anaerophilus]QDF28012.1 two-component system response regulator [Halarcobacter anaerophilus]RXJ61448.1 DNA-binding response regulator [Halarcobacter anaerophilus]
MPKDEYKNLKILYVEDEDLIRSNAITYLNRLFYNVYEAKDAIEAINLVEEKSPHIIITDIKMPKMNGLDMIRKIREYNEKIQIIVLSAFTDTKYLLDAIDLGLAKYLTKPIRHETIYPLLVECSKKICEDKDSRKYLAENCYYDTIHLVLKEDEKIINLTKNEQEFINLLCKKSPNPVTYEELQSYIWYDDYMSENAIRLLVRDLRKKLPKNSIKNISRVGYKIDLIS